MSKNNILRHVVLFKFKEETSAQEIQILHEAFCALAGKISKIHSFEWGLNKSPENFHQGFTHCYLVTFQTEADRDLYYTPHPDHQAFVSALQAHLEKVFVVDYWANPIES